jgi:hypothetical protein
VRRATVLLATCLLAGPGISESAESLTAKVSASCELRVRHDDVEIGSCWSAVCESQETVDFGCGLSALIQAAEISPSPDRRWLAVISVGEGHPILEVVDLQALLNGQGYKALTTVNPYPGTINLEGWADTALLVTSDMPLPDLSPDGGGIDLMLPEMKTFLLKPDLWKPEASP